MIDAQQKTSADESTAKERAEQGEEDVMEKAQEQAAEERENDRGYQ